MLVKSILMVLCFVAIIQAIGVLFYFFWERIFKKINISANRKLFSALAAFISTSMICSVFIAFYIFSFNSAMNKGNRDISFNQNEWDKNPIQRYKMAKDILDSKMCIQKDTNQIKELLGNPSYRDKDKSRWHYNLGFPQSFRFDKSKDFIKKGDIRVLRLSLDNTRIASVELITIPGPM